MLYDTENVAFIVLLVYIGSILISAHPFYHEKEISTSGSSYTV